MLLALSLRSSLTETEPPFVCGRGEGCSFLFLFHFPGARAPPPLRAVYTVRYGCMYSVHAPYARAPVSAHGGQREHSSSPHNFSFLARRHVE